MRKPHEVNVRLDSSIPITHISSAISSDIVSAYILIKGFKTICSAIEHVVVTKVK